MIDHEYLKVSFLELKNSAIDKAATYRAFRLDEAVYNDYKILMNSIFENLISANEFNIAAETIRNSDGKFELKRYLIDCYLVFKRNGLEMDSKAKALFKFIYEVEGDRSSDFRNLLKEKLNKPFDGSMEYIDFLSSLIPADFLIDYGVRELRTPLEKKGKTTYFGQYIKTAFQHKNNIEKVVSIFTDKEYSRSEYIAEFCKDIHPSYPKFINDYADDLIPMIIPDTWIAPTERKFIERMVEIDADVMIPKFETHFAKIGKNKPHFLNGALWVLYYPAYRAGHVKYWEKLQAVGDYYINLPVSKDQRYIYNSPGGTRPIRTQYLNLLAENNQLDKRNDAVETILSIEYSILNSFIPYYLEINKDNKLDALLTIFHPKSNFRKRFQRTIEEQLAFGMDSENERMHYAEIFKTIRATDISSKLESFIKRGMEIVASGFQNDFSEVLLAYPKKDLSKIVEDLLKDKKNASNRFLLLMSAHLDLKSTYPIIEKTLQTEKDDAYRNGLLDAYLNNLSSANIKSYYEQNDCVALAIKRKKIRNSYKLDEGEISALSIKYKKSKKKFELNDVLYLLYRSSVKYNGKNLEVEGLIDDLTPTDRDKLIAYLTDKFVDKKTKFKVFDIVTILEDLDPENAIDHLYILFQKAIQNRKQGIADFIIERFGEIQTRESCACLDAIASLELGYTDAVETKAEESLQKVADEKKLTALQLEDWMLTEEEISNENAQIFQDWLKGIEETIDFELTFNSKKDRKNQIKVAAKNLRQKLENYMLNEREWKSDEWKDWMNSKPVLNHLRQQIFWATFDDKNQIKEAFFVDQNGKLIGLDGEVNLLSTDNIRVLHPVYLSDAKIEAWKEKCEKENIKTIFPIIDRPVFRKIESENELRYSYRLKGELIKGAVKSMPARLGNRWSTAYRRIDDFDFTIQESGIVAVLIMEDPTPEMKIKKGKLIKEIWFYELESKNYLDFTIKDVPEIFYSELYTDILKIVEK